MKIVISGYTYTRQNLFEVFEKYPEKQNLFFILPNNWTAKGGLVKFRPFSREGFKIYHSRAFFQHSNYPVLGGLMKGWMPFFVFRLFYLRFIKGAKVLFTTGEPNLISTLYNAFFAKIFGMKHVFHFWENIPYEDKDKGLKLFFKKLILKTNILLSDGAICGMHKAEDILRSLDSKIKIGTFLHAGFDTEKFRPGLEPALKKKLNLEGKLVLLFVGALGYRKGIHLVISSMPKLLKSFNNIVFVVVGSGEYENELRKLSNSHGLDKHVIFMPWVDNKELPGVYNSADILVYPSIPHEGWEEQFGYTIGEASLCGLPIVSTRSGSIYEVLKDGETGIMVEPGNQNDLVAAIEKLAADPALRVSLGENGRSFVSHNFSNEIIAKKMYEFFRAI